jgi:hypothetical protein
LKKAVDRSQYTGRSEAENKPGTASFQRVASDHRRYGEEAEEGQAIHQSCILLKTGSAVSDALVSYAIDE